MAQADDFDSVAQLLFGMGMRTGDPQALAKAMRDLRSAGTGLEARLQARLPPTARLARGGPPRRLPEAVEALVTDTVLAAVRDAGGRFVLAYLEYGDGVVRVRVQRDGAAALGAGLPERARAAGGRLELVAGDDGLSVLHLDIPTPG